jgi:polyisoprenoid-binding protein YceI
MLGPEVLDSEHYQEIVFKSTGAEAAGQAPLSVKRNGQWLIRA